MFLFSYIHIVRIFFPFPFGKGEWVEKSIGSILELCEWVRLGWVQQMQNSFRIPGKQEALSHSHRSEMLKNLPKLQTDGEA